MTMLHLATSPSGSGARSDCNPSDGHILNDDDAMKLWQRTYEPGWAPEA